MKRYENSDNLIDASSKLSFNEWLRRKDAERRMKKRLIDDAKNEIRQELFEIA